MTVCAFPGRRSCPRHLPAQSSRRHSGFRMVAVSSHCVSPQQYAMRTTQRNAGVDVSTVQGCRDESELQPYVAGSAPRGLELIEDLVGNQWAWWGDPDPDSAVAVGRPGIATGSHLDSVPDGGVFDGPLGVVSALAAIDVLREAGVQLNVPIGIVNFVDEDGAGLGWPAVAQEC